jgi:CheY-like chemotaxis protein
MNKFEKKMEVLLVEDDKINQFVVATFLRRWGLQVTIANNGEEAIAHIAEKYFHIVLMDMQMPGMNGLEATRIIRSLNDIYFQTVPIIMFTAHVLANIKVTVFEHGATDVLSKPFEPGELHAKIEEHTRNFMFARPRVYQYQRDEIRIAS